MATRDIYFKLLYDKAAMGENIAIVTADLGAIALDKFVEDFPGRFVNLGIAEQNLIAVSAGIANSGKKVFAYGNAPFIWSRALDQIREVMGNVCVPITLLSVGVGLNTAPLGPSHFVVEDLAALRGIPNLQINAVNNAVMAKSVVEYSMNLDKPNYIRMENTKTDSYYEGKEIDYRKGFIQHGNCKDIAIVSTASTVYECIKVAEDLKQNGIDAGVIEVITFPVRESEFINVLSEAGKIVTAEEHILQGGLGSYVCEMMTDHKLLKPLKRIGLDFKQGYHKHYGTEKEIRRALGIDAEGIKSKILSWV